MSLYSTSQKLVFHRLLQLQDVSAAALDKIPSTREVALICTVCGADILVVVSTESVESTPG